jgi:hypothetical protein
MYKPHFSYVCNTVYATYIVRKKITNIKESTLYYELGLSSHKDKSLKGPSTLTGKLD